MATKKHIKSSKKSTTKSTGIDKQLLSHIEKELLECAKKGQPVLLYGKDTIGREDLIRKVHIKNGGIDASWEHVKGGGQFKSEEDMVNEVRNTIADYMKDYKVLEIQENWETTSRTWISVDCAVLNGKGVFEKLTYGYSYATLRGEYICSKSLDTQDFPKGESWFNWYPYVMRSGLLFINNLNCSPNDEEDTYYYKKLVTFIEKRKNNDPASGNWLLAYTYDSNDFPQQFRNQFKEISFDSEEAVVVGNRQQKGKFIKPKAEETIKLKIVKDREEVYWDGNLLPTIKETNFNILLELAKTPGELVKNDVLFKFINSDHNEGVLLNQRITAIRNAFPSPYNDIKQSQCIIPDAKRNKGYRSLNLTKDQVEKV